ATKRSWAAASSCRRLADLGSRSVLEAVESLFFFQAADGIRVFHVTGVQTCALPICSASSARPSAAPISRVVSCHAAWNGSAPTRSEERRVGKEGSSGWWPEDQESKAGRAGVGIGADKTSSVDARRAVAEILGPREAR